MGVPVPGPQSQSTSPTVFRAKGLRFFFFSREEPRVHIHARGQDGTAKFWIEPDVELDRSEGLSRGDLRVARQLIEEREHEIREAWKRHFGN